MKAMGIWQKNHWSTWHKEIRWTFFWSWPSSRAKYSRALLSTLEQLLDTHRSPWWKATLENNVQTCSEYTKHESGILHRSELTNMANILFHYALKPLWPNDRSLYRSVSNSCSGGATISPLQHLARCVAPCACTRHKTPRESILKILPYWLPFLCCHKQLFAESSWTIAPWQNQVN